ncbi:hypothetical protein [Sorangium sp. So ce406]|uniref:hypothetical protein n=1 Tax=Sorangium sp. So ce406 TaxID=3133311 RepID=UPI003F5BE1A6
MDVLNIVAAVATFIGTGLAWREARRAMSAAQAAGAARDQILDQRGNFYLASMTTAIHEAQNLSRSLLAPDRIQARGKALSRTIDSLQMHADKIAECDHLIVDADQRGDFKKHVVRLREALSAMRDAGADLPRVSTLAKGAHEALVRLATLIRRQLDTAK